MIGNYVVSTTGNSGQASPAILLQLDLRPDTPFPFRPSVQPVHSVLGGACIALKHCIEKGHPVVEMGSRGNYENRC